MDANRFDALTRAFSEGTTHRGLARLLGAWPSALSYAR